MIISPGARIHHFQHGRGFDDVFYDWFSCTIHKTISFKT